MGTRARLGFLDSDKDYFGVYQHWDGYPETVRQNIKNALEYAFDLPRFQADDFAAAYIAASKLMGKEGSRGGDIYCDSVSLKDLQNKTLQRSNNIEYTYLLQQPEAGGVVVITVTDIMNGQAASYPLLEWLEPVEVDE